MLSIKKLFRKICILGVSSVTSINFCSPFVYAAAPTKGDLGISAQNVNIPYEISQNSPIAKITLIPSPHYSADGTKIIKSVDSVKDENDNDLDFTTVDSQEVKLYLRITDAEGKPPSDDSDWVEYTGTTDLDDAKLKPTKPGTYYVYYYIDGLDKNTPDNGAGGTWASVKEDLLAVIDSALEDKTSAITNFKNIIKKAIAKSIS